MIKLFVFICLALTISYQQDCSFFSDSTCGGHNTDYQLKCQKFDQGCETVEIDDHCKIIKDNSQKKCIEDENIPSDEICTSFGESYKCKRVKVNENCIFDKDDYQCKKKDENVNVKKKCEFDYYKKNCIEVDKTCTDYSDENCGGIGTKNGVQCIKLSGSGNCQEFNVDNICEINNNGRCSKKEGQSFDETKYECKTEEGICHKREILCEEKGNTKCSEVVNQNCKAINYPFSSANLACKEVQIVGNCKIEGGNCVDGDNIASYEKCSFTEDSGNIKCIASKKICSECTSSCSNCQTTNVGYTCTLIPTNTCKEILIHQSCKIDSEGKCVINTNTADKTCKYNPENSICILVDNHCSYESGICTDKTDEENKPPKGTKCSLTNDYKECSLRNKVCSDYNSQTCNDAENKNCFWYQDFCLEYTKDDFCEIVDGNCQKRTEKQNSFSENEICSFSYEINAKTSPVSCTKKDKCTGSWGSCSSYSTDNTYCGFGYPYCKKISLDNDCEVDSSGNCVHKDSNYDQKKGICDYDDSDNPKACKIRTRNCNEFTESSCGTLTNCVFYPNYNHCIKTDNYCTIIDGTCEKKDGVTEQFNKKCGIVDDECVQIDKTCGEISKEKCNTVPRKENQQCFNFDRENTCKTIDIDEYCYVNNEGKCVNSKQISKYVECAFNSLKTQCKIRNIICDDFNDDNCGNFSPETKLCFNFGNGCKEVQIDSNCQINEKNECVAKNSGNSCSFDEKKEKCVFKNNNNESYLIKLNFFIILSLFFLL